MRLKRLKIDRLPGIDEPYEIEAAGAGVHVVFGPNGIGKSSICRALEALYWGDRGPSERTYVTGEFEIDGESWRAERDGARLRWRCEGEERMPPAVPESHHRRSVFLRLRDLLDPARDGTRDIAAEIRRQMSGGFDLAGIVADLFPAVTPRAGHRQRRDFASAARAVQEVEGRQAGLEHRAAMREALESELEGASAADRRLSLVRRAAGLATRTEEHTKLVRRIEAMPAALARLSGEELREVERLQKQADEWNARRRRLEGELEDARAGIRDARLSAPIDGADLLAWRQRADKLDRLEFDLRTARTERTARQKEVEAALRSFGGSDLAKAVCTLDEHARLFEFLREAEDHRARVRAIEWRLKLLKEVDETASARSGGSRIEDLRSGIDTLRRWLRSPAPGENGTGVRSIRLWLILAAVVTLVGVGLAAFGDPGIGLLLLGVGAGLVVPLLLMRRGRRDVAHRAEAEEAFARLGISPPDAWSTPFVEARLRILEVEVHAADARADMAKFRAADRQSLKSDLGTCAEGQAALDGTRRRLLGDLGLGSMRADAELVDTARALDRLREARISHEGAAGRVEELEYTYSRCLAGLAVILQEHGEPEPEDAAAAKAYLGSLADRNDKLNRAISGERQATDQRETLAGDRESARAAIRQLYAKASLDDGDLPGLMALVGQLEDFRALQAEASDLESRSAQDREELAEAGESGLAELDTPSLRRLEEELAAKAARVDELWKKIAEIKAEVREARRGHSLQDLIASREEAREELGEHRDAAVFAEAGRFLIDVVEREHEQTQMPRVFQRARDHFYTFTHHGYELRLGRDSKSPRLFAIEPRNGESRELDELSDGTRAQLLLAARVAFAEEVERGLTLPLFLDEALDQSDPARFEAIAGSLGRLAEDQGRQIFYLTSDPVDRERIRRALAEEDCAVAAEIDLGVLRGRGAAAVKEPAALRIPPRTSVPEPAGVTAEEYGRLLGVPPFAPVLGHSRQHFFFLLSDDLALLHVLLEDRIEWVGQWGMLARSPFATRLASRSTTSEQIGARVRLLEVFCEGWGHGRGRPVDRDALAASRALSQRYLDDVVEVARELGGDPVRLLAALREKGDPRLRGFRSRSTDALGEYFRDSGHLDDRTVLGEDDVRLQALASPPANELPDGVASDLLDRWLAWTARVSGSAP